MAAYEAHKLELLGASFQSRRTRSQAPAQKRQLESFYEVAGSGLSMSAAGV